MTWNKRYKNDQWAKELGIEITHASPEKNTLSLPFIPRNLQADGGVVHGGIIGSLLHDCGLALAAEAVGEAQHDSLRCLDFQANYLKAAKDCDLIASAQIIRQSRKFLFIQSEVLDPQNHIVATSRMLFSITSGETQAKAVQPYLTNEKIDVTLASHPMVDMMNTNMVERRPGFSVNGSEGGLCRVLVENLPVNHNYKGEISNGAQIFAADSAGVFSCFGSGQAMMRAATVDLKLTFCAPVLGEGMSVLGESLILNDGLVHHQLSIFGATTKDLKAFGTMTLAI
ncbi:MAG: hotdog fold thioesterase [Gammaproteobacteria bacterium]|nr:hotdog fold thioesterase [Gammaproteobacteria bacterium]